MSFSLSSFTAVGLKTCKQWKMRGTALLLALTSVVLAVSAERGQGDAFMEDGKVIVDPALYEAAASGVETIDAYVMESLTSSGYEMRYGRANVTAPVICWATFKPTNNVTGWATLKIRTNASCDDDLQMYAAGHMEGFVTAVSISQTIINMGLDTYCEGKTDFCQRLDNFLEKNSLWAESMISKSANSSSYDARAYGHQFGLISTQMLGLIKGYALMAQHKSLPPFTVREMQLLLFNGDMDTLESALGKTQKRNVLGSGSCSAMVKVIGDYEDILFTHDTWTEYSTMLRIYKQYDFPVRQTGSRESDFIPGQIMTFSSYPGMVYSMDDFYQMQSGLAVMETTIGNYNETLSRAIVPETAMYSYRVQIANRLATTSAGWAKIFSTFNSGTYNNQWMVFDYKRFTPGSRPQDGAFVVLEQLPTLVHYEDMTGYLLSNRYWPSYNLPHFKSIFAAGNFQSMVDEYGDFFDYQLSPRRRIFDRDHHKVTDLESLKHFMRYNDFQHDEDSRCACEPPYSGENGIAARSDLNPANGVYAFPALGHRLHGATDCKITSSQMMPTLKSHAIAGPTNDQQPTFKWSTSGVTNRPLGHPDVFDFDFTVMSWEED